MEGSTLTLRFFTSPEPTVEGSPLTLLDWSRTNLIFPEPTLEGSPLTLLDWSRTNLIFSEPTVEGSPIEDLSSRRPNNEAETKCN